MRGGAWATALFFCLLLLPSAAAFDAWVDWQGNRVTTLAPGKQLPSVVVKVNLSGELEECKTKDCSIAVITKGITATEERFTVNSRACAGGVCTTAPFTLKGSGTISVRAYVGSSLFSREQPITLVADDTIPRVSELTTGYCDEECMVAANVPTPFTVRFTDTKTSFAYRNVYVTADGVAATARASRCEGTTCTGRITIPCAEGKRVTLRVKSAVEDAQNAAVLGEPITAVCTGKGPSIIAWETPVADGLGGQPVVDGSITYKAKVRVAAGEASGIATSKTLQNETAACESDMTLSTCTWVLSPLRTGTHTVDFTISDPLGLEVRKSVQLTVLNITRRQGARSDFLTVTVTGQPPEVNRMGIDLARANYLPYPVYVPYDVARKRGNARIVHQELKECWYKMPHESNYTKDLRLFSISATRSESRVLHPARSYGENRLNLQSRADRDTLAKNDTFDVKCQVDFTLVENGSVYDAPESENLSFKIVLREAPLGQPGRAFLEKIEREQEELESGKSKTIMQMENVRQKLDMVCQVQEAWGMVQTVFGTVNAVGQALCAGTITAPAGLPLDLTGSQGYAQSNALMKLLWDGDVPIGGRIGTAIDRINYLRIFASNNALLGNGGPMKRVCRSVNCRTSNDIGKDVSLAGSAGFGTYVKDAVLKDMNVADPEKSLMGSVSTMCVGGVIYNLNKDVAIDCQYLQCLKDQSATGASVAVCEHARSYRKCMQVMGNVGDMPYARILKNVMANINGIMKNFPHFIARWGFKEVCDQYLGNGPETQLTNAPGCQVNPMKVTCRITDSFMKMVDIHEQSTKARAGIDPAVAEQALKTCKDALKGKVHNETSYAEYLSQVREYAQMKEEVRKNDNPFMQASSKWCAKYDCSEGLSGMSYTYSEETKQLTLTKKGTSDSVSVPVADQDREWASKLAVNTNNDAVLLAAANGYYPKKKGADGKPTNELDTNAMESFGKGVQQLGANQERTRDAIKNKQVKESTIVLATRYQANGCGTPNNDNKDACKRITDDMARQKANVKCEQGKCEVPLENCEPKPDAPCSITISEDQAKADSVLSENARVEAIGIISDYVVKAIWDQELYEKYLTIDAFNRIAEKIDPQKIEESMCNEKNSISDNDDGAVYFTAGDNAIVTGTFGAEVIKVENESGTNYGYINIVYVSNPWGGKDYLMNITYDHLTACETNDCPRTVSITNGAQFNLSSGSSFGNGNMPKTRVLYFPGKYGRMCLQFNKPFPEGGRTSYCRLIKEKTFVTGTSVPPASGEPGGRTGGSGSNSGGTIDASGGWT